MVHILALQFYDDKWISVVAGAVNVKQFGKSIATYPFLSANAIWFVAIVFMRKLHKQAFYPTRTLVSLYIII